jgi:hypothetical protein
MKITTKNVMEINATCDERTCLNNANETLGEILNYLEDTCGNFGEGILLYNPATGEIVQEEELMRARGVLQFILDSRLLEIHI